MFYQVQDLQPQQGPQGLLKNYFSFLNFLYPFLHNSFCKLLLNFLKPMSLPLPTISADSSAVSPIPCCHPFTLEPVTTLLSPETTSIPALVTLLPEFSAQPMVPTLLRRLPPLGVETVIPSLTHAPWPPSPLPLLAPFLPHLPNASIPQASISSPLLLSLHPMPAAFLASLTCMPRIPKCSAHISSGPHMAT